MRGYGLTVMMMASPVWATTQCPSQSGEKSSGFMFAGWAVLVLFLIIGIVLMRFTARSTQHWRPAKRAAALLLGIGVMLGVWIGGFLVFLSAFVLVC